MAELIAGISIDAPIERCFDITRSIEMHQDSSMLIGGRAVGGRRKGLSEPDDETTWSARFWGLRFRLRTRILSMAPPYRFHEQKVRGLIKDFGHVYQLAVQPDGKVWLEDRFWFVLPFGWLGRWMARWFLLRTMSRVQQHRLQAIKEVCESDAWQHYLGETGSTSAST